MNSIEFLQQVATLVKQNSKLVIVDTPSLRVEKDGIRVYFYMAVKHKDHKLVKTVYVMYSDAVNPVFVVNQLLLSWPVKVVGKVKRNGKVMEKVKTEKLCRIVRKDQ